MLPKELFRKLLKEGRWTNESEIVRYGIELVRREVDRERLSKYPDGTLARCYKEMKRDELADDAAFEPAVRRITAPTVFGCNPLGKSPRSHDGPSWARTGAPGTGLAPTAAPD